MFNKPRGWYINHKTLECEYLLDKWYPCNKNSLKYLWYFIILKKLKPNIEEKIPF